LLGAAPAGLVPYAVVASPVGLILSSEKDEAVAHYVLGNLPNKVLASEYKLALPNERELAREIARTRKALQPGK